MGVQKCISLECDWVGKRCHVLPTSTFVFDICRFYVSCQKRRMLWSALRQFHIFVFLSFLWYFGEKLGCYFFSDFCLSLAAWHHWHTVCLASQTHARRRMQIFLSLALVGFSQFMSSLRFMVDWLIFGLSSVLHSKICMLCFVKCPVKASCDVWQFQVGFGSQNWGMLYLLYICHFSARDVVSLVALSLQIILCW